MKTHAKAHLISSPEELKKIKIPIIDIKIHAGIPVGGFDGPSEPLDLADYLSRNPESTFAFVVEGDSMTGSGINSGDVVIVDRSVIPKPNSIVLFEINGEFTIKKFERKANWMYLVPTNPAFAKLKVQKCDIFRAWGVVRHLIKSMES